MENINTFWLKVAYQLLLLRSVHREKASVDIGLFELGLYSQANTVKVS